MSKCGAKTEVYSRVCGYFRPVSNWNRGKKEEFKDRKVFEVPNTRDIEYFEKHKHEMMEIAK
jgi:hypothetical protein